MSHHDTLKSLMVDRLKDDFIEAVEGIKKHLVRHAKASDLTFVGKFSSMDMENFVPEMVCISSSRVTTLSPTTAARGL